MDRKKELNGVADTLFIPLTARIEASRRFSDYFYDARALELATHDVVQAIGGTSSEYAILASTARYYNMDRFAAAFIEKHGQSAIVTLGVGLETMNYRLEGRGAHFYSIDLPNVIESRLQLLGNADNETLIACDITDLAWTREIDASVPVMMIVSGVFQYFQPEAVHRLLAELKKAFPGAEMVFDATDEVGIGYARKYVKKTGNMDAMMYFYINDPQEFAKRVGVELLDVRPFYGDARRLLKKRIKLYTRIAMKVTDDKGRLLLLHIKL